MKNEALAKAIKDVLKIDIPVDYEFNDVEIALSEFHKREHSRCMEMIQFLNETLNDFKQKLADSEFKNSRV